MAHTRTTHKPPYIYTFHIHTPYTTHSHIQHDTHTHIPHHKHTHTTPHTPRTPYRHTHHTHCTSTYPHTHHFPVTPYSHVRTHDTPHTKAHHSLRIPHTDEEEAGEPSFPEDTRPSETVPVSRSCKRDITHRRSDEPTSGSERECLLHGGTLPTSTAVSQNGVRDSSGQGSKVPHLDLHRSSVRYLRSESESHRGRVPVPSGPRPGP